MTKEFIDLLRIDRAVEYSDRIELKACSGMTVEGSGKLNSHVTFRFIHEGEKFGIRLVTSVWIQNSRDVFGVQDKILGFTGRSLLLDYELPTKKLDYIYPNWIEHGVEELMVARIVDG